MIRSTKEVVFFSQLKKNFIHLPPHRHHSFRLYNFVFLCHIVVRILGIRLNFDAVLSFQMPSQIRDARIVLGAFRAGVTLLFARMHKHVLLQVGADQKRSIAFRAFECLFRCVYPLVNDQFPFRFESFVAFVTLVIHFVGMVGVMRLQILFEFECFGANFTLERTQRRMASYHMASDVVRFESANRADFWRLTVASCCLHSRIVVVPDAKVHLQVVSQCVFALVGSAIVAGVTVVVFARVVVYRLVHRQTVSLLVGSTTFRANVRPLTGMYAHVTLQAVWEGFVANFTHVPGGRIMSSHMRPQHVSNSKRFATHITDCGQVIFFRNRTPLSTLKEVVGLYNHFQFNGRTISVGTIFIRLYNSAVAVLVPVVSRIVRIFQQMLVPFPFVDEPIIDLQLRHIRSGHESFLFVFGGIWTLE